jgi:hypothetical protein
VVDHVGCCVEEADFAAVDDFAFGIDEDEVGRFDEGEGDAEGVDPELVGVDGVLVEIRSRIWLRERRELTRRVMCPATPSSKPYLPKMRNAAASLPLR